MAPEIPRTLFVGTGTSAVCWYRAALPAMALGADWCGVRGVPPALAFPTGGAKRIAGVDAFADYDVVVLQQPRGAAWVKLIRRLQAGGTTVLFEIDDDLESVRKAGDHGRRGQIDRDFVRATELAMRVCDGVICATDFLARRYRGERTWVCRNGLDLRRYDVTRPAREHVTIGWAGGTGHQRAFDAWLPGLRAVMRARPATRFVSIGPRFAAELAPEFGEQRCVSIPFGAVETYPAAMANLDIALAPAGRSNFFRAKSDLRWLEASALGLPVIADPVVYPDIEPGVTGFHAATPEHAGALMLELVDDRELRARVGAAARETVRATRSIEVMAEQWRTVLSEATATAVAA
ncbi:MAG: glycosyltransferase family protein [Solirubrobacteraceae bacterium]